MTRLPQDGDCEDCQIADADVMITEYEDGVAVHVLLCGPCALARHYAELDDQGAPLAPGQYAIELPDRPA